MIDCDNNNEAPLFASRKAVTVAKVFDLPGKHGDDAGAVGQSLLATLARPSPALAAGQSRSGGTFAAPASCAGSPRQYYVFRRCFAL
jgi:hypothetical protein